MKSDLDARPVFLQRADTIKSHFLICYLTVLLERIFPFKVLGNEYSTSDIFQFKKDLKVTKGENKYINTTKSTDFIQEISRKLKLPLTNYFLSETQVKSILKKDINAKFSRAAATNAQQSCPYGQREWIAENIQRSTFDLSNSEIKFWGSVK